MYCDPRLEPMPVNAGMVEQTLREIQNTGAIMNDSGIHDFDVVGDQSPKNKAAITVKVDTSNVTKVLKEMESYKMTRGLPTLRIKRLTPTAILPTRGSERAIGLDLYADQVGRESGEQIQPGFTRLISTGIAAACPPGYYIRVAPRSGLSLKNGLIVMGGVVDEDYRGEIGVILHNSHPWNTFWVSPGMRIAQMILERADILPVQEVEELNETVRGGAGYGSTGA